MSSNIKTRLLTKSNIANIVSGFVVVAGVILKASGLPVDDLIIGGALGFLFGVAVKAKV